VRRLILIVVTLSVSLCVRIESRLPSFTKWGNSFGQSGHNVKFLEQRSFARCFEPWRAKRLWVRSAEDSCGSVPNVCTNIRTMFNFSELERDVSSWLLRQDSNLQPPDNSSTTACGAVRET